MWRRERLYKLKLKRLVLFKEFWVCSGCGTPRRLGNNHYYKKCGKCGSTDPANIVLQEKGRGGIKDSLSRSKRSRAMLEIVKDVSDSGVVRRGLGELIKEVQPPREITKQRTWLTQVFTKKGRKVGELPYDICFHYVPKEIREIMSEKVMMQTRIPKDLHQWFKKYTQDNGVSMTKVVIAYLEGLRQRNTKNYEVKQI